MKIHSAFFIVAFFLILISGCVSSSPPPTTSVPPTHSITQTFEIPSPQVSFSSSGKMIVHFIDVGQGDSELIQSPSGKVMLIDAGPTDTGTKVVDYLRSQGVSTIDVVVVSHPHEDHIGGMSAVLNSFTVKQFIDSGYPHTTSTYEKMLTIIDQKNIPFRTVKTGDAISFDPAISINVFNPQAIFFDDINQNSIVMKMTYGKQSFLFTGDAGGDAENNFANSVGHVDILKVAHHGSATSSGSFFLSRITPTISIIEVGAGNSYGHPSFTTVQRLQQTGSAIYRTDTVGTIKITSDGNTNRVEMGKMAIATMVPTTSTIRYQSTSQSFAANSNSVCDCSSNRYNCADFPNHANAQACYDYCIAQGKGDIHQLDANHDGQACESLK